jgi:asparagine synthase (glutamine-hydrolysing)
MCGISGLANCGDKETLARMTSIQAHHGPDDSGLWEQRFPDGSYIALGSRRLAILDLSPDGRMPMCNPQHMLGITDNGEIHNFRELRHELKGKGHRFASESDTEVVLHLYEEEGPDCVKRLNGMFAFAICDLRPGTLSLFVARDHFGMKPFYYTHHGDRFAFASEIKALLQVPGIDAELGRESLHPYLTLLWVPDPATMFRRVFKLAAGHYGIFRQAQLKTHEILGSDISLKRCSLLQAGGRSGGRNSGAFPAFSGRPDDPRGTQDWPMQIWQFLRLELWMQTFLDGDVPKTMMTDLAGRATA